jgi:hypothetical protein
MNNNSQIQHQHPIITHPKSYCCNDLIEKVLQIQRNKSLVSFPMHVWILFIITDILGLINLIVEIIKLDQIISVGLVLGMVYIIPVSCIMFFHEPHLSQPGKLCYIDTKVNTCMPIYFVKEIICSTQIVVMILLISTALVPDTISYATTTSSSLDKVCWYGDLQDNIPIGPASCKSDCIDYYHVHCYVCIGRVPCPDMYVGSLSSISPLGIVILMFAVPVLFICCVQCVVYDWNPAVVRTAYNHNVTLFGFFILRLGGTLLLPLVFIHFWLPVFIIGLPMSVGFIICMPLFVAIWVYTLCSGLIFKETTSTTTTTSTPMIELRENPGPLLLNNSSVAATRIAMETYESEDVRWAVLSEPNDEMILWKEFYDSKLGVFKFVHEYSGEAISQEEYKKKKEAHVVPKASEVVVSVV